MSSCPGKPLIGNLFSGKPFLLTCPRCPIPKWMTHPMLMTAFTIKQPQLYLCMFPAEYSLHTELLTANNNNFWFLNRFSLYSAVSRNVILLPLFPQH